jgi:hypothetical protein
MSLHATKVTEFLAAYGALLSSIGFGWNLYRDLLDRARLQVSADIRRIAQGLDGKYFSAKPSAAVQGATAQLFVVMTVVNVGRRPVQWQGWGGKYHKPENGKTGFTIIGRDLPKMLSEGQTHSEITRLEPDLRPAHDNVTRLFVWDAAGKYWELSRNQLKRLKREAREYQEQPKA